MSLERYGKRKEGKGGWNKEKKKRKEGNKEGGWNE